jgi:hypothetical protein
MTEKRINGWLNLCIRVPGILAATAMGAIGVIRGEMPIHWAWFLVALTLTNANALYYADRVIRNHAVAVEREKKRE